MTHTSLLSHRNSTLVCACIIYQGLFISVVEAVLDYSGPRAFYQMSITVILQVLPHLPVLPMRDLAVLIVRDVHGVMLAAWQELDGKPAIVVHDPQNVLRVLVQDTFSVVHSVILH